MNEEQNQQASKSNDSPSTYPVEPIGDGEGASVLHDCPSTKPSTDLNGWLEKRWPIEVARLRRFGVLDPEGVLQDTLIGLNKTSETNPRIWQWLGLRLKDRGSGTYRKQMRESKVLGFLAGDHAPTKPHAEDAVESLMIREGVGLLLRDLSLAKRRVLEAHYFEGLTLEEISQDPELGGLSVPALKSQLHRTREELLHRCIELFGSLQEARNHLGLGEGY